MGALLIGATFASHTLIAYPIISRFGLTRNEAISVVVGATVFTDVLALFVLAIISNIQVTGHFTFFVLVKEIVFIGVYAFAVLRGLPLLGKLFFQRFSGRDVEFQFVLVALFAASVGAELIGLHAIVGAFLAGLAINSTIPNHSAVKSQTIFLGNSFFIPMFMIFVGMNIDPAVFIQDPDALILGLIFTIAVYASKFIAAWITAKIFHYKREELIVFWGLSQAQAAATIATVLIGMELGLFDLKIFNASILTVLFTAITSPIIVEKFGKKIEIQTNVLEAKPVFNRILVPIANPHSEEGLLTLASTLCDEKGTLLPICVAQENSKSQEGLENQRKRFERIPEMIENPDITIEPVYRIGRSVGQTIVRASIETDSSLIVMGWHGEPSFEGRIFGTVLDHVFWHSKLPVIVALIRIPINAIKRLCFALPGDSLHPSIVQDTFKVVLIMAKSLNIPLHVLTTSSEKTQIDAFIADHRIDIVCSIDVLKKSLEDDLREMAHKSDLIVIPTTGSSTSFTSSLGRIPERLAEIVESSIVVIHK